mgnify:CR=1 FL=1
MAQDPNHSRRDFLKGLTASAFAAATGIALSACDDDDNEDNGSPTADQASPAITYTSGVASGDPLNDRVILWTRTLPAAVETVTEVTGRWEIAADEAFAQVISQGDFQTSAAQDFTVKVDATGLSAGNTYYYRFQVGTQTSPVGRTKTLPTGNISQAKFALFSCSNYPAGYFHVYQLAAQDDYDAVLHVGDYIYEYGAGGYASQDAEALGRVVEPPTELFSLADYRRRYAQYRSDPDLQALHAKVPWIVVWDDHEVANNAYVTGAENHDPSEGDFASRRAAAVQAYHEWLPIRAPDAANLLQIYRRFAYGDLLTLHMLDTRLLGRDQQLSLTDPDFASKVADPDRQLLGEAQMDWLLTGLQTSTATWEVLGQQVIMGRVVIPQSILAAALNADGTPNPEGFDAALSAYLTALQTPAAARSEQQQALVNPNQNPLAPYNPDAWDGYFAARETILNAAAQQAKNLVVLSGDSHNSWGLNLATYGSDGTDGVPAGVEFAGTSVSSPGFEGPESFALNTAEAAQLAAALTQIVPGLEYANLYHRGFVKVTFTQEHADAEYIHVDTVKASSYQAPDELAKTLRVPVNSNVLSTA